MGLDKMRDSALVGYHANHKLFQIPATVFRVAKSDFKSRLAVESFVFAVYTETRGIDMVDLGAKGELLHAFHGYAIEERCRAEFIDSVKGSTNSILIKVSWDNSWFEETF